jgi:hypothetical protein
MQLLRRRELASHFVGDIQDHPHAQLLPHLEQLAPLHGFAAAFDLAHERLADADAAPGPTTGFPSIQTLQIRNKPDIILT